MDSNFYDTYRRRHDSGREPDGERRGALRLPAGEESPLDGSGQSHLSRISFPPCDTGATRAIRSHGARSSPEWGQRTLWGTTARRFSARRTPASPTGSDTRDPHDQRLSRARGPLLLLERPQREPPRRSGRDRLLRRPDRLPAVSTRTIRAPPRQSTRSREPQTADDRRVHRRRRAGDPLRPFRLAGLHVPLSRNLEFFPA